MNFNIWQSVQVTNKKHPRHGQAGTVQSAAQEDGSFLVKFDLDGVSEAVDPADIRGL